MAYENASKVERVRASLPHQGRRWLGSVAAIPVAAAALFVSGCGEVKVASPKNFFLTGTTFYGSGPMKGKETAQLVGCIPTASNTTGGGKRIGTNLIVGAVGTGNLAMTTLGNSYRVNPDNPKGHRIELTGSSLADEESGQVIDGGTIDARALADFINTDDNERTILGETPQKYGTAVCVQEDVPIESVRRLRQNGSYTETVPIGSTQAYMDLGSVGASLVSYSPTNGGLLTVLTQPPRQ